MVNLNVNGEEGRVWNFESNGQVEAANSELTGALPSFSPLYVTVDSSGGSTQGVIYAADFRGTIQQFDADGEATAVTITVASVPANGTVQGGGLPPVVNTGSFSPRVVAVDGMGALYVVDASAEAIDVFDGEGVFLRQLAVGKVGGGDNGMAVDAAGQIYLGAVTAFQIGSGLFELSGTSGECIPVGCTAIDPAPVQGVTVDNTGNKIYTTGSVGLEEGKFSEYDLTTHALLGVTRVPALHEPFGIGVQESSGEVIVADTRPSREGTIQIYGPVVVVPDVATLAPTGVGSDEATLNGEIGAAGVAGATCVFQYVDQAGFEAHRFEGAAEAPCEPGGPFEGVAMNPVHAQLTDLHGGTTYHERLVGTNANGTNAGEDEPFITLGPTVAGTEAVEVTETAATLVGTVNPRGASTTYRFQYLTQAAYEANSPTERWAGATEVPSGGKEIGAGTTPVPVSIPISGLTPGVAYRLRIVASSTGGATAGTTDGEEIVFTTQASVGPELPDGRRYEQASPVGKNGADIQGAFNSVQASLSGGGITFFVNTGIPGGEGGQEFPTYMASRAADGSGWSTQGLLPPASYGPTAHVLGWTEGLEDTYDFASQESAPGPCCGARTSTAR